jgi:hypothetical protein
LKLSNNVYETSLIKYKLMSDVKGRRGNTTPFMRQELEGKESEKKKNISTG